MYMSSHQERLYDVCNPLPELSKECQAGLFTAAAYWLQRQRASSTTCPHKLMSTRRNAASTAARCPQDAQLACPLGVAVLKIEPHNIFGAS